MVPVRGFVVYASMMHGIFFHFFPTQVANWFRVTSELPGHLDVRGHKCSSFGSMSHHHIGILKGFNQMCFRSFLKRSQCSDGDSAVTFDVTHDVPHHPLKCQLWNEEFAMLLEGLHVSFRDLDRTRLPFLSEWFWQPIIGLWFGPSSTPCSKFIICLKPTLHTPTPKVRLDPPSFPTLTRRFAWQSLTSGVGGCKKQPPRRVAGRFLCGFLCPCHVVGAVGYFCAHEENCERKNVAISCKERGADLDRRRKPTTLSNWPPNVGQVHPNLGK